MGNNVVITIGREFGSGGREIGKKVADRLGIKFYDKELLQEAAKESGFCREIFENQDEKPTNSFLYSLVMDTYSINGYSSAPFLDMPLNHKVFLAQFETIKKIAEKNPVSLLVAAPTMHWQKIQTASMYLFMLTRNSGRNV